MLTISRKQMEALASVAAQCFMQDTLAALRSRYPERCAMLGADGLEPFISGACTQGQGWGITGRHDLGRWLKLALLLWTSERQGALGWVPEIMTDETVPPDIRVDRLEGTALLGGAITDADLSD